jgi:hypothetical protein
MWIKEQLGTKVQKKNNCRPYALWKLKTFEILCSDNAVPHNNPYNILFQDVNIILYYDRRSLFFFLSFFFHPMPYNTCMFLNVTVPHHNVFKKAVYSQTSNWLLVGYCTTYVAVEPNFYSKRFIEEWYKRLQ